jgi:endonuclease G
MNKKLLLVILIAMFLAAIANAKPVKLILNNVEVMSNCDQVINDPYQRKCINFKARKPRFNFYYLTQKNVDKSIKKRLRFKDDPRMIVQNYIKCYYHSGKDRGHLAPDASFDFDYTVLKTTYLSSNIVPEAPYSNRILISRIEKEFRKLVDKYKEAYVITGAHFIYTNEYKFNPNNKYHLNCGYYPNYIYKIIYIPKVDLVKLYVITNKKPYKIIKANTVQTIRILRENHIIIRRVKWKH